MNTFRSRLVSAVSAVLVLSSCAATEAVGKMWPFGGDDKPKQEVSEEGRISILAFDQQLAVDPALEGRSPEIPAPEALADWSQPGGNRTNAPHHIEGSSDLQVAWRSGAGEGTSKRAWIGAPPVVSGGKLYLLDAGQEVRAVDASSGKRLWSKSLRPDKSKDKVAVGGGLAIGEGRVFVASGYGGMVAFDANTGEQVWRSSTRAPFRAAPTFADGRVFAVTNDSELMALDANTGAVLWTHQAIAEPAGILAASSPAVNGDTIIAPFASGEIVALLSANGRRLWVDALTRSGRLTSLSSINDIAGRPVADAGAVYAVSHSGVIAAIDQRSGTRMWARGLASTQTPWVAGDTLYVVTVDGELAALDRKTGGAFWVTQLERYEDAEDREGRISWTGPILIGGNLLLASSNGKVALVSPTTGKVNKTIKIGSPVYIPPIAANGTVYLVTDDARLIALR